MERDEITRDGVEKQFSKTFLQFLSVTIFFKDVCVVVALGDRDEAEVKFDS